ncbi:MAG: hypothetical protein COZ80_06550 [Ignavibacteria bacterium CG_4_8_14_3_um_filter_37_9]|nr:MAG: hypothetical protein AUJ54_08375 [Ignavibacteria bacterium CG1_02_37_35]PIW99218.1 MAG: hypothetical protein COZ80_06550 [Ignavibacteria bacterium CG_4_8_14_3_um_filter_37_9]PIX93935.1 MAG: hypothetical protein COZ25_08145 [Ignavibacteria bacterium CG_4_10_14_3_um_filter_37_18]
MKTKLLLIVFFAVLGSTLLLAQNYFPLAVGNKWQFKVTDWDPSVPYTKIDTTIVEVIKDTLAPNNVSYFLLNSYFPLGDLVRSDSLGIYYYDALDSTDCLVYNYSAELYEGYKTGFQSGGDSAIVTLDQIDSSNVFMGKIKTLSFSYNWMIGHSITFGENTGPIIYHTGGDGVSSRTDYELIGYKIDGQIVGSLTGVKNESTTLDNYWLDQNYPNPFNPTTTISFSLPEGQNVELTLYNILGRKMVMLLNEYKQAGKHKLEFISSGLPSGVYFYQLKAGQFIQTKRLVILK